MAAALRHASSSDIVWFQLVTIILLSAESVRTETCGDVTFEVKLQQEREECVA